MTELNVLNYLNALSMVVVFIYCCYRLGIKVFTLCDLELWMNVILIGGSIMIFAYSFTYPVIWPQAMFNAAVALYFLLLTACRKSSAGRPSENQTAFL